VRRDVDDVSYPLNRKQGTDYDAIARSVSTSLIAQW